MSTRQKTTTGRFCFLKNISTPIPAHASWDASSVAGIVFLGVLYPDAVTMGSILIASLNCSRAPIFSYWICKFKKKKSDTPKARPSRIEVSAVTDRLPFTIWFMRVRGTFIATASWFWLIPRGSRNSSCRIIPGCSFSACIYFIRHSGYLFRHHRHRHPARQNRFSTGG